MLEEVNIQYVNDLPMMNLTDSFLVTNEAAQRFSQDLRDFFPVYWEKMFLRRALTARGRLFPIHLFSMNKKGNRRYLNKKVLPEKLPRGHAAQRNWTKAYLANVSSYGTLRNKLSVEAHIDFGIWKNNVFTLSTYDELLEYLVGIRELRNSTLCVMRYFSSFLHQRERYLWPLDYFEKESRWVSFIANYGPPYGKSLIEEVKSLKSPHIKKLTENARNLLRATKWHSTKDLTNDDIANLREKIGTLKGEARRRLFRGLRHIVNGAIDYGVDLTYKSQYEFAGQAVNRGRLDGSFSYYLLRYGEKNYIKYWAKRARDYVAYRVENDGLQRPTNLCDFLNRWLNYLIYADSHAHCPRSIHEVDRSLHIIFNTRSSPEFLSYANWMIEQNYPIYFRHYCLGRLRTFFDYIIVTENLTFRNPIEEIDIPSKPSKHQKTHRLALTTEQWIRIREIILNDPVPHYETVVECGRLVRRRSPTLQTIMLCMLELGMRYSQAAYLDKDKVLHRDGFLVSGDKNVNREQLQIIPYFDNSLKEKIEECICWQNKYNYEVEPVGYAGNKNSPFGKVRPLFRLIGKYPKPVSWRSCSVYLKRILLKYQKLENLTDKKQLIVDERGRPFDMCKLNIDEIGPAKAKNYKCKFDLHSLRVTAATLWFEAGVDVTIIQDFITGHATLAMLLHYIKIREADKVLKKAFEDIIKKTSEIKSGLESNIDDTIEKFLLRSRVNRSDEKLRKGINVIKETPMYFWRFFHYGICPTGACPDGIDGRCGFCPLFISGPPYKNAIAAQINLISERIVVGAIEMRNSGTSDIARQASFESLVQEFIGWVGWYKYIERMETEMNSEGKEEKQLILYSQVKYDLTKTSPIILHLQRCVDITVCPEVYSEQAYHSAMAMLKTILSKIPRGTSPEDVVNRFSKKEVIEQTAGYFLKLIKQGKSHKEIEALFGDGEDSYLPNLANEELLQVAMSVDNDN